MLTADLALNRQRGGRIEPLLLKADEPRLLERAFELIALVREHQGRRRAELDEALTDWIGLDPDYRVLRGWAKLLIDQCEFAPDAPGDAERLREAVFLAAAKRYPVVTEEQRAQILADAGCLDGRLFSDRAAEQIMASWDELSPEQLLHRYNLAQAQAVLYRAREMAITIAPCQAAGYRPLFAAVKAYRLIHTIEGSAESGYSIRLDGPVSLFHRSQKYGIQMAVFLPALLLCKGWRMRALIDSQTGPLTYEVSSDSTALRSHYSASEAGRPDIDRVLSQWAKRERAWTLVPTTELVHGPGATWTPDLTATQAGQEKVYIELLGYWTPRSLTERLEQIARAGVTRFLLTVSDELRCSREEPKSLPPQVLRYKTTLDVDRLADAIR